MAKDGDEVADSGQCRGSRGLIRCGLNVVLYRIDRASRSLIINDLRQLTERPAKSLFVGSIPTRACI